MYTEPPPSGLRKSVALGSAFMFPNCHDRCLAGRLTYVDGSMYDGMWLNDRRHGVGTFYSTNGDAFVGTFSDDKRHGLGTTYMPGRGAAVNALHKAQGQAVKQAVVAAG